MDGFERYAHLFLGHDPLAIERHVAVLETLNFHAGRYWPLEAALWDLAGKAAGKSVAELLGGQLERIAVYASTGEQRSPAERAESALRLRDEGFRALKLRIDRDRVEEGLAAAAAVREAVGDSMELMIDLNQGWRMPGDRSPRWDVATARERLAASTDDPADTRLVREWLDRKERVASELSATAADVQAGRGGRSFGLVGRVALVALSAAALGYIVARRRGR